VEVPGRASSLPYARAGLGGTADPSLGKALSRRGPAAARIGVMTTIALITGANKGIGFETAGCSATAA
jgi:hypothetical protein